MSGKYNEDLVKELVDNGRRKGAPKRRKARSAFSNKKQRDERRRIYEAKKKQNKNA